MTRRMVNEGKLPNIKKMIEMGSAREDLVLLGAMPTITPPMWTTRPLHLLRFYYMYKIFFLEVLFYS